MVDAEQIEKQAHASFNIYGDVTIDAQGHVHVDGSVKRKYYTQYDIPVPFDTVNEDFDFRDARLTSLQNAPHTVGGDFDCSHNVLTSLKHGPDHVAGSYYCQNNPIEHGDGFPLHVGSVFRFSYNHKFPLLRLLAYDEWHTDGYAPETVLRIMNKYAGQGKKVMLNCALELKAAGYAENAKW